jgi:hypothetical protein
VDRHPGRTRSGRRSAAQRARCIAAAQYNHVAAFLTRQSHRTLHAGEARPVHRPLQVEPRRLRWVRERGARLAGNAPMTTPEPCLHIQTKRFGELVGLVGVRREDPVRYVLCDCFSWKNCYNTNK